jgi:hypothetical protein
MGIYIYIYIYIEISRDFSSCISFPLVLWTSSSSCLSTLGIDKGEGAKRGGGGGKQFVNGWFDGSSFSYVLLIIRIIEIRQLLIPKCRDKPSLVHCHCTSANRKHAFAPSLAEARKQIVHGSFDI